MTMRISEIVQVFLRKNLQNLIVLAAGISVVLGTVLTVSAFQRAEQEALFFSDGMKPYILGLALSNNEDAINLYIDEVNRKNGHQFTFTYENATVARTEKLSNAMELTLGGQSYGRLLFFVKPLKVIPWLPLAALLVVIGAFALFERRLFRSTGKLVEQHVVRPLERLAKAIEATDDLANGLKIERTDDPAVEVRLVENALSEAAQRIQEGESQLRQSAVDQGRVHLAQQVAHDIRSPLAALEMISSQLENLPEDNRLLLRHAIGRIRDIANNLLDRKGRDASTSYSQAPTNELLTTLMSSLISEKREQYRGKPGLDIESIHSVSEYGLFAYVQPVEFSRVLSNLINNAVEAMDAFGRISVRISADEQKFAQIEISDTGKGIPPEIISKLMQRGETHGKAEGSGLGLAHARESMEKWGGSIQLTSQVGIGTTVILKLPRAETPGWFVERLQVDQNVPVVVVDDDPSIHDIWNRRFNAAGERSIPKLVHIYSGQGLRDWVQSNEKLSRSALFLVDYELGTDESPAGPIFGLDVLLDLGLSQQSILVTSRTDETGLRLRCEGERVRMIPKGMAPFVPIVIQAIPESWDALLIDDDELVRMTWQLSAKHQHLKFMAFPDTKAFLEATKGVSLNSPVYVDLELGDGQNGREVVCELKAMGFERIFLATGYEGQVIPNLPTGLSGIIGKEPPWETVNSNLA